MMWRVKVIIKNQAKQEPCLEIATFQFRPGRHPSEELAREAWQKLGFPMPGKAEVVFEKEEEFYDGRSAG